MGTPGWGPRFVVLLPKSMEMDQRRPEGQRHRQGAVAQHQYLPSCARIAIAGLIIIAFSDGFEPERPSRHRWRQICKTYLETLSVFLFPPSRPLTMEPKPTKQASTKDREKKQNDDEIPTLGTVSLRRLLLGSVSVGGGAGPKSPSAIIADYSGGHSRRPVHPMDRAVVDKPSPGSTRTVGRFGGQAARCPITNDYGYQRCQRAKSRLLQEKWSAPYGKVCRPDHGLGAPPIPKPSPAFWRQDKIAGQSPAPMGPPGPETDPEGASGKAKPAPLTTSFYGPELFRRVARRTDLGPPKTGRPRASRGKPEIRAHGHEPSLSGNAPKGGR